MTYPRLGGTRRIRVGDGSTIRVGVHHTHPSGGRLGTSRRIRVWGASDTGPGLRCCFDAFDRTVSGGWGQADPATWAAWSATDTNPDHQGVNGTTANLWMWGSDYDYGAAIGTVVGRAMYAPIAATADGGEWIFRVRFPRGEAGTADNNFAFTFGFTVGGDRWDGASGSLVYRSSYGGDGTPHLGTDVVDWRYGYAGGHGDEATWYGLYNGLDGVYGWPGWESLNDWWTVRVLLDRYGIYWRAWRDESEGEFDHIDPGAAQPGDYVTGAGRGESWIAWQMYDDQVSVAPDNLYVNAYSYADNHWASFDWMALAGCLCECGCGCTDLDGNPVQAGGSGSQPWPETSWAPKWEGFQGQNAGSAAWMVAWWGPDAVGSLGPAGFTRQEPGSNSVQVKWWIDVAAGEIPDGLEARLIHNGAVVDTVTNWNNSGFFGAPNASPPYTGARVTTLTLAQGDQVTFRLPPNPSPETITGDLCVTVFLQVWINET